MRIVIQARTSSSRLPGKALLPIAGWPLVSLSAQRAGRDGADVILATSNEPTDDALASLAAANGIQVVRGPDDDVFQRYVMAAMGLDDEDVIIRFTGDNVLPDADFARRLHKEILDRDVEIVGTRWPDSELPYGLFGEAMRVRALRHAARHALSDFERLHVSPWIWRNCTNHVISGISGMTGAHQLKCSVSNFVDYQRIVKLFEDIEDPVSVPWRELVERLQSLADARITRQTKKIRSGGEGAPLVLGTAQLGMPYGISGRTVFPSERESVRLIQRAVELGVAGIDTARAYQLSEERVGLALEDVKLEAIPVITKLDPLSFVPPDAPAWAVRASVHGSVYGSCRALRLQQIPILLLHRGSHRNEWSGAVWRYLLELRNSGVIGKLGLSAQNPMEALAALHDPDVEHIQLPMNILDDRWQRFGIVPKMLDRKDVTIHARSIFLQGLLLHAKTDRWPRGDHEQGRRIIDWLEEVIRECDRENVADLLIAYVRALDWVDGLVIGHDKPEQLEANARYFNRPPLTPAQVKAVDESRPLISDWVVDPSKW